ncbi:MAG: hypothetical protein C0425_03350 [Chlorobiaceae bacterium]|nr:hypothetical protein [Chlorobiaceae bacterium]MBA4309351.1 hypothetical protein [Chlorobiaceae bacterium]
MKINDEKSRAFMVIGFAIIFLMGISNLPEETKIFGYQIKPVDLFMDIKPDSLFYQDFMNKESKPSKEFELTEEIQLNNAQLFSKLDMNLLSAWYEKNKDGFVTSRPTSSSQIGNSNVPITGNVDNMKYFFDALKQSKNRKVRIADFSDSGNEGDLVTADLRQMFQSQFGGNGVGWMSITSQDITFRVSSKHSFSNDWRTVSVLTGGAQGVTLNFNGFTAIPNSNNSWVRYEAGTAYANSRSFNNARLFYTNARASQIKYSVNNGADQTANLVAGADVKELVLATNQEMRNLRITATQANQAQFFGVNLDGGNGVYIDNFPWRGNTGISFRDFSPATLKQFNRLMDYKLIILTFGANMLAQGNINWTWYENQKTKVINDLKEAFPQTSILIVGVGDKAIKRGTRFITDPNALRLMEIQKKVAEQTGVAYWNKFDAMGGMNSMTQWVNANLAAKDYGHLNYEGSKRMAQIVYQTLMNAYNNYK